MSHRNGNLTSNVCQSELSFNSKKAILRFTYIDIIAFF